MADVLVAAYGQTTRRGFRARILPVTEELDLNSYGSWPLQPHYALTNIYSFPRQMYIRLVSYNQIRCPPSVGPPSCGYDY